MTRDMPIGLCAVCDEPLDLSDAGICKTCGQGFCWGGCGGWHGGEHACHNCAPELVEEIGCPLCGEPWCDAYCGEEADSPQEASDDVSW